MRRDRARRRRIIRGLGAAGLVAVAGCTDVLGGSETDPSEATDQPTEPTTGASESTYELDVQPRESTIDLTDLPTRDIGSWDDIRDEDFLELEATVYEERDGEREEADDYEFDIQLGDETVEPEQADNLYRIACTELETGENDVTVTADVDGQTLEQSATVTKQTPDAHLIEAIVDDEQITQYSSPYEFDTQRTSSEEIAERRLEEHPVWEDALEYVDENEIQDIAQDGTKKELLEYTDDLIWEYIADEGIAGGSANAQQHAATQQEMIQQCTDYGLTDVYGNGFNNPADITVEQTGNHGTKAFYIDGDWFHQETAQRETLHADNFNQMSMVGGVMQDFVSVIAEFEQGEMETVNFDNKMLKINAFYTGQAIPGGRPTAEELRVSDPYGSTGFNMIRENENRELMMAPVEAAADHHLEAEKRAIVAGTPNDPVIISTNDEELHERIKEESSFQDTETILNEALN